MKTFELKNIRNLRIEDGKVKCIADNNNSRLHSLQEITISLPKEVTLNFLGEKDRKGFGVFEIEVNDNGDLVLFTEISE